MCSFFFIVVVHVDMKNKYGYLSLVDYPAMIVSIFHLFFLPLCLNPLPNDCSSYFPHLSVSLSLSSQVYSILMVIYVFYAILWLVLMALEYKDLVRLQFWILAVILLGFLEKVFFVAEYGSANNGMDCEEHLDCLSIIIFFLSLSLVCSFWFNICC